MRETPENVDLYINAFPEDVKSRLQAIRELICEEAPDATECISYGMPTYKLNGNLVHFAGYKNHIGLYPTPTGISAFEDELKQFTSAKGSVQFLHSQELPLDLIRRMVRFRVSEQHAHSGKK
jgi:uncharacterized protein YdhG (YjbR/CyaY superfamily)